MKKIFLAIFVAIPLVTSAVDVPSPNEVAPPVSYELLAPLPLGPGGPTGGNADEVSVNTYIPAMVKLIIAIAGALAVIRIIVAGIQYMSTDAFSGKSDARETIQNAVIGLLLAIGAYSILNTLNPDLVAINFNIEQQSTTTPQSFDFDELNLLCTESAPCITGEAASCDEKTCIATKCTSTEPCVTGIRMCTNCAIVADSDQSKFAHKTVEEKGCLEPGPCQINSSFVSYLANLEKELGPTIVSWWVTEMFPPTVEHIDPCHVRGTCVDVAIIPSGNNSRATSEEIAIFLTALDKYPPKGLSPGMTYEYEMCPKATLEQFLAATVGNKVIQDHKNKFKCEKTTTGDNIHINFIAPQ